MGRGGGGAWDGAGCMYACGVRGADMCGGEVEERRAAPMMSFIFSIFICLNLRYILNNLIVSSSL